MAEYILSRGAYVDAKGRAYKQGDTIISDVDLHKKHGEKFAYKLEAVGPNSAPQGPTMRPSADEGRYDVVDGGGVVINEKTLTLKQAATMLADHIADSFVEPEAAPAPNEDDEDGNDSE